MVIEFGLPIKKDPIEKYKNRLVRISLNTESATGVLYGYNSDEIYLCPCRVIESLFNPDGSEKRFARIEEKIPLTVVRNAILAITPLRNGYLEEFVKSFNAKELGDLEESQ